MKVKRQCQNNRNKARKISYKINKTPVNKGEENLAKLTIRKLKPLKVQSVITFTIIIDYKKSRDRMRHIGKSEKY